MQVCVLVLVVPLELARRSQCFVYLSLINSSQPTARWANYCVQPLAVCLTVWDYKVLHLQLTLAALPHLLLHIWVLLPCD